MSGVNFDRDSARRIGRVVRHVERSIAPTRAGARGRTPEILPPPYRRFEMTAALSLGGSATATWIQSDGTHIQVDSADVTFTANDFQGQFSKPATTATATGAKGLALRLPDPDGEVWEIVSMNTPMHFNALAKGAVAGEATYTVDNLEPLYGCYSHVVDADEEVTVTNRFGDDLDDNAKVTITWNGTQEEFQTADGTCPV